ncbi:diacylglycerol/lipid kinase family protein [Staphylococcus saprophyticus]|uniref:diacylglycerol/lipid kinase family protein n=1 Tax=Staphylococcus saprophyticus TaxID=29385 RepID=UPI000E0205E4|nr:diacylglycerol kinase family protein [Staphylococcus saprophyticus]MDT3918311.1 diacylglycerol kinase family lipid kinase [Staphylococcus saprophyticus]MDT3968245.1 diacylglycerol kinase family lipid kinase [Staphylococcus saprophyticus]MDT3973471.1 diacylglycerol kinase family lipid kinase [Staphylococcus saprophyticus]MDT3977640.1 diacylglycerol kinase family lipid kinase [Staphylococcus saprophyticus]MDT3986562.1 diacylglycerol kinase family lipid kinase [Staphylococcus saprophyticus]
MVSTLTKKKFKHGVLFYHEHTGIKDIYRGLGDVATSLTTFCKHLSIQLSENEGDIITFCQKIKDKRYSDDVDIIFILGGDGTVNELVNGIMKSELDLPIGIIPGGTFNDFVKTLNLNPRHKMASQQLMNAELRPYDVMKINDEYALNFVGLGLIVQNAENVQNGNKDIFGKLSYVGSTVKTLLNPEHFDYKISVDDQTVDGNTSMLVVANGPFIGGSRIPLTDLSPNDGYLNTFIFKEQSSSVLNDVFKQRDSMNWNKMTEGIKHLPAKKITIETDPQMKVDIDGEINLKTPLEIEVIPNAIQILTLPEAQATNQPESE